MADVAAHIEYLFSAQDMASGTVTQAQEVIDSATAGIESSLEGVSLAAEDSIDALLDAMGEIQLDDLEDEFQQVEQRAVESVSAMQRAWEAFKSPFESVVGDAVISIQAFGSVVAEEIGERAASATEKLEMAWLDLTQRQRSFLDLVPAIVSGLSSAAVNARDFASGLFGIGDAQSGIGKFGGLIGKSITGPLGLVLKLLEPLISAVVDTLSPAFETLGALVKNSLAPLGFLFETMAQQLAPLIQRLITPFVGMLEVIAVQLGNVLADILDTGKAAGPLAGLFTQLLPVIQNLVGALVGLATRIFPVVMSLLEQVLPIVSEIVGLLGEALVEVIGTIGEMWSQVGPQLVETIVALLNAVKPLIPPLLNIATLLLTKILAPALIKTLQLVLGLVQDIAPYIELFAVAFAIGLEKLIPKVKLFADAFAIGLSKIKSFGDLFTDVWEGIKTIINLIFVGESPSLMDAITLPARALSVAARSVTGIITGVVDTVRALPDVVLGAFKTMIGAVKKAGLFIVDTVQTAINLAQRPIQMIAQVLLGYYMFWFDTLPREIMTFITTIREQGFAAAFDWLIGRIRTGIEWVQTTLAEFLTWALTRLSEFGARVLEYLGLGEAVEDFQGAIRSMIQAVNAPMETLKAFLNENVIATSNAILGWSVPVVGTTLSQALGWGQWRVPMLAEGGVVGLDGEGVLAGIGEAGPEAVLPLKPEVFERVLEPIIPDLELPGIGEAVDWLRRIHERLSGTLRVQDTGGRREAPTRTGGMSDGDLDAAVGLAGIVR